MDDLITLAVHTEERALKVKEILESHGIAVTLEDIVPEDAKLPVSVKKVRIPVSNLMLGLKVTESGEALSAPLSVIKLAGTSSDKLLIPVDFSQGSLLAVKTGFYLAKRLELRPVLLSAYVAPMFNPAEPFAQVPEDEVEVEVVAENDLRKMASMQLDRFVNKIKTLQKSGDMIPLDFDTELEEGIPEQVIHAYCRDNHPTLAVMATRGIHKKASDLVGSVTAEVIDNCRVPVVTVPENLSFDKMRKLSRIAMFCTLTPFDLVTVRMLMRAFSYPACEVTLIPSGDRPVDNEEEKLNELASYFNKLYPTASFTPVTLPKGKFDESVSKIITGKEIQLIIVPNKKSSAFTRFFRPTLAHRILFDNDLPLLVLPI